MSIASLSITGGIFAAAGANSRGLTVFNADLYGGAGIDLESSNDGANIVDSFIHGSASRGAIGILGGIHIEGASPTITGNAVYGNIIGIYTYGPHPGPARTYGLSW